MLLREVNRFWKYKSQHVSDLKKDAIYILENTVYSQKNP